MNIGTIDLYQTLLRHSYADNVNLHDKRQEEDNRYYLDTYSFKSSPPLKLILPRLLFTFFMQSILFVSSVKLLDLFGHWSGHYATNISLIQALIVGSITSAIHILFQLILIKSGAYNFKVKISRPLDEHHEELIENIEDRVSKHPNLSFFASIFLCMISSWIVGQFLFGYHGFSMNTCLYIVLNEMTVPLTLMLGIAAVSIATCCFCCFSCCCCRESLARNMMNAHAKVEQLITTHPRFSHVDIKMSQSIPIQLSKEDAETLNFYYNNSSFFKNFNFMMIRPMNFMKKRDGKFIKDNMVKESNKDAIDAVLEEKFLEAACDMPGHGEHCPQEVKDIIHEYAPENICNVF
jgi:hypothetical protein